MSWIKRNLYFVVGAGVALLLMGFASFYLFTKWKLNNEAMARLNADYATLQRLNSENPHPGSGTVDNISEARAQQRQLLEFIGKLRKSYQPIQPIPYDPENPKVSDRDFSAALSRTIHQLQRAAERTSVNLPPAYSFGFEAQRPRVTFAPGSPAVLATQLGDIKAICDILIETKVNSIDGIRRERVSRDDFTGPQTDYTERKSVTNDLAVITPYDVTFRCFSSELASVLSGFAASPHAIIVKSLNVESGTATNMFEPGMFPFGYEEYPGGGLPQRYPGAYPGMGMPGGGEGEAAAAFARRYGTQRGPQAEGGMPGAPAVGRGTIGGGMMGGGAEAGGGGGLVGRGVPLRGMGEAGGMGMGAPRPAYNPRTATQYAPAAARSTALPTVLDEKQLKVTMQLAVIKPLPEKSAD
jgi:hypothetical protein